MSLRKIGIQGEFRHIWIQEGIRTFFLSIVQGYLTLLGVTLRQEMAAGMPNLQCRVSHAERERQRQRDLFSNVHLTDFMKGFWLSHRPIPIPGSITRDTGQKPWIGQPWVFCPPLGLRVRTTQATRTELHLGEEECFSIGRQSEQWKCVCHLPEGCQTWVRGIPMRTKV